MASLTLRPNTTALVMQDHRLPSLPRKGTSLSYPTLAAFLNAAYCLRHGCTLLFFHLAEPGCAHPRWGVRHPSYCKLAALASALAMGHVEHALWLDSDAWIQPDAPPLPLLLQASRPAATLPPPTQPASSPAAAGRQPVVSLAWDLPFSSGPNAGLMLWRGSRRARRLLRTWWHRAMVKARPS